MTDGHLGIGIHSGELGAAGHHAHKLALHARARLRQLLAALVADLLGEVEILPLLLVLVQAPAQRTAGTSRAVQADQAAQIAENCTGSDQELPSM